MSDMTLRIDAVAAGAPTATAIFGRTVSRYATSIPGVGATSALDPAPMAPWPGSHWRETGPATDGTCGGSTGRTAGAIGKCLRALATSRGARLPASRSGTIIRRAAHGPGQLCRRRRRPHPQRNLDRSLRSARHQQPGAEPPGRVLAFEAAWGPDGAVCVRRTRIPELLSTEGLANCYPHLGVKIGPDCSEKVDALLWNRS
jgi:hypothetical protein